MFSFDTKREPEKCQRFRRFEAPQSLRDSSPKGERARRQRRAFAESGAANAAPGHDPSCEKVVSKRPQAFRNYK